MPKQRVSWITGWGVPPDWWRPAAERLLPEAEHCFHLPGRQAALNSTDANTVVAWSLGALHLMEVMAEGQQFSGTIILLAPFLAFCSEHGRGGKCSLAQLKWLRRWVERDREAALTDFYERAGIVGADPAQAPSTAELLTGLDRLAQGASASLDDWGAEAVTGRRILLGERDGLLDARRVAETLRGSRVVPGASHSAIELLQARPEVWDAV